MSHEDEASLDNWDFERAEKRPGVQKSRAIVSVAFSRDDFEQVGLEAERLGMKVSEFIRRATLDRARPRITVFGAKATETKAPPAILQAEEDVASASIAVPA